MQRPQQTRYQKTSRIVVVVLLSPLIILLAIVGLILFLLYRAVLYLLIWLFWLPKGKSILYISSDSPIWKDYMEQQILPLVERRAVILNWSQREKWSHWSFSTQVFRTFGGSKNFNPMVVVFLPFRPAKRFRFLEPFKAWKAGDQKPVEQLRQSLISCL